MKKAVTAGAPLPADVAAALGIPASPVRRGYMAP